MTDASSFEESLDIAIIGMAGRFPGATDVGEFWENVCAGVESIRQFTEEELRKSGIGDELLGDPAYIKASPVLEDYDKFDAALFGYSPREAATMDPQQRLMLECASAALEDAGYDPARFYGRIGVFAGAAMNTYFIDRYLNSQFYDDYIPTLLGNDKDYVATRISFKLNLTGPSITVQTACSTSLVAVHLACQALLNEECELALAGGVSVRIPQVAGYLYQEGGVLTPDGHVRPFDAQARGTLFGSGVGVVALKRLADAVRDCDSITAVIKGSAVNNDGSNKANFMAPSISTQGAVIAEALANADVDPDTVGYVEAHGTGTYLGDPIEFEALKQAYGSQRGRKQFCGLGSVKGNVGHLDAAAGVIALIKTSLALKHSVLPPSINFTEPNPQIDFANSPFYVNTELRAWPMGEVPRRAGVSSLGMGGTNAHVVLEEAPPLPSESPGEGVQLLLLSAKTPAALEDAARRLRGHLEKHPDVELRDAAYTLQVGRRHFEHRRVLLAQTTADAVSALGSTDPGQVIDGSGKPVARDVVFMFSGQGAQYVNMGRDLYENEALFREHVDACSLELQHHLDLDLRTVIYPTGDTDAAAEALKQTRITQPALFTIEYALARLWMSWGIHPKSLVGHSIGEYVAACLAGVFSMKDALAVVAARGQLMQSLPPGDMLALPLPEEDVIRLLDESCALAAVNGPRSCVVSGDIESTAALADKLSRRDIPVHRLNTSHAFHSHMMDPILEPFVEVLERTDRNAPSLPFVSNVTGTWITPEEAIDPGYWARHLRSTVRFADCLAELLKVSDRALLEVGPGKTLATLARRMPDAPRSAVVSSLRHPKETGRDTEFVLTALGKVWLEGIEPDWQAVHGTPSLRRVSLPTYPYERSRHWIDAPDDRRTSTDEIVRGENDGSILGLLAAGNTEEAAERLVSRGDLSVDEAKVVPKLLLEILEGSETPKPGQLASDLLYKLQWLPSAVASRHGAAPVLKSPEKVVARVTPRVADLFAQDDLKHYGDLLLELESLSLLYVQRALISLGWSPQLGQKFTTFELAMELGVKERHRRFLGRLLQMLAEDGVLGQTADAWETTVLPEIEDPETYYQRLAAQFPAAGIELELLRRSGRRLADVLRGTCDPLELLFPEGDLTLAISLYQDSPAFYAMNTLLQESLAEAIADVSANETLRVIEIGGGTGGTTSRLLPQCPADRTEYTFTDVSELFTNMARDRFCQVEFVECRLLDIGRSPVEQDFPAGQYDVVVASNVLHATRDLGQTLQHVQELLAPGGILLMLEGVAPLCWIDLFAGGLDGWWMFEDLDLRPSHSLLPIEKWRQVLAETDFSQVDLVDPSQQQPGGLFQHVVIVARKEPEKDQNETPSKRWLVFADSEGVGQLLADGLRSRSDDCLTVTRGEEYRWVSQREVIVRPDVTEHFNLVLDAFAGSREHSLDGIVYLWGINTPVASQNSDDDLESLTSACATALRGLQAAVQRVGHRGALWLATRNAQRVTPADDVAGVFQSGLIGFARVIGREHTGVRCTAIDLPATEPADAATMLLREIDEVDGETEVAYRGQSRYLSRLIPIAPSGSSAQTVRFSAERSHLIIGGLGGLGQALALWMVERGARHIVLVSRRGLSPDSREGVAALEGAGARVEILAADVSERAEVARVLGHIAENLPPLAGIVHAAMVLDDGIFANLTVEELLRVMAPKVLGAWHLHVLTRELPLDSFLMCSSNNALLGNPGQANYVAANVFLEALSQHRLATGLPTMTVDWPFLENIGVAARRPAEELRRMRASGIGSIDGKTALRLIESVWNDEHGEVAIMPVDWQLLGQAFPDGAPSLLSGQIKIFQETASPSDGIAQITSEERTSNTSASDQNAVDIVTGVWRDLLGLESIGLDDDFFDIGGDSLQVASMAGQLSRTFDVQLSINEIFETPTIRQLVEKIHEHQGAEAGTALPAKQAPIVGPIPLSPGQLRFLSRESDPNHFNVSILLTPRERLEAESLREILTTIVDHHDSLRLRVKRTNGQWTQTIDPPGWDEAILSVIDLSGADPADGSVELSRTAGELQGSLDLVRGPVLRCAVFNLGDGSQRLLLIFHHLALDRMSLKTVLSDLQLCCAQVSSGEKVSLPAKTNSFKQWTEAISGYATSLEKAFDLAHFLGMPWGDIKPLPLDKATGLKSNTNQSARTVSVQISNGLAHALLKANGFRLDECLLAALAKALGDWTGASHVLVDVLNHGRRIVSDLDLSRTTGNFLTYMPVVLKVGSAEKPDNLMRQVREANTVGWKLDAIQQLADEADATNLPRAEVLFNFVGRPVEADTDTWLSPAEEDKGDEHAAENLRDHLLAVRGEVVPDGIELTFVYSANFHEPDTIQTLANGVFDHLRELLGE